MGPILEKCVKFRYPSSNRSREIPPEAVGGGRFDSFFAITSDRNKDVISGVDVDNVGVDVSVKLSDSWLDGSRDIRGADFASNERTKMIEASNSELNATGATAKFRVSKYFFLDYLGNC